MASSYQVPVEVPPRRVQHARHPLAGWVLPPPHASTPWLERLAYEILDAANNTGAAVKRKEDIHKMAESNKAFAHYRW